MGEVAERLLERAEELETLHDLLDRAKAREGALVLIEGPAGIGKTCLMEACAEEAVSRGLGVVRVRGDELVMESSFAGVRELLWQPLDERAVSLDGAAQLAAPVFEGQSDGEIDRERASAVLHGLYWLVADLADLTALVLLIDDAHWLDAASARFVEYLARRIESLPVLLAVALRPGEGSAGPRLAELEELAACVLRPRPLSEDASAVLVRRSLGMRAGEELCRSCHEATSGNPFYLRALATALESEPANRGADAADRVRELGSGAIARSVLMRLARLGHDCELLAQAAAVLGPGAQLRQAASLAGLGRGPAQAAADQLRSADLLSDEPALSFTHPIVSEAILSELPPSRRAMLHSEAARRLQTDGAPVDRVAAHLLSAEPYGEAWVVDTLRTAARHALGQGAPEAAVSYLRRALDEPPPPEQRLDLMFELGRAEALRPVAQEFDALRRALSLADDPRRRAEIARELALALFGVLQSSAGRLVLEEELMHAGELDAETVERLEASLLGGGIDDLNGMRSVLARAESHLERAARGEVRDARLLVSLAMIQAVTGRSAEQAASLARQALADERLLTEWLYDGYVSATCALCWSDRFDEAASALDAGIAEAQRRGSAPMALQHALMRADAGLRAGDLDVAEDYAERAVDLGRQLGAELFGSMWMPVVSLERGEIGVAGELVESVPLDEVSLGESPGVILLAQRGRVRVARGDLQPGLGDLLEADRRMSAAAWQLSVLTDWVPAATQALVALGRRHEASDLAERELEQARAYGAPRRLGIALSVAGALSSAGPVAVSLHEAVDVLARVGARLEHARALVRVGTRLREAGRREEAREPLSQALDIAHRIGAHALAEHARDELVASGARPRRKALSGPEALTPAEFRTARMAAEGLTNRQIAQALFVSTKTIETQLSQAYLKLDIHSRGELARALGERGGLHVG